MIDIHGMALVIALHDWKAGEAARFSGVSPDLQRQWRKLGVLTPLTEKKKTKFNIITLPYVVAARALIDNGAGHKEIQRLINGLGAQIMYHAVLAGEVLAHPPVQLDEVEQKLREWSLPVFASHMKRRYFAFRNDPPAIGSNHRDISFDDFRTFQEWMRTGVEQSEYDDEVNTLTGEKIDPVPLTPEEIAEDEEWRRDNPPPPPLPPGSSAVVLDVEAISEQFLSTLGRVYGEVWDDERDLRSEKFRWLSGRARTVSQKCEALLAPMSERLRILNAEMEAIRSERETTSDAEELSVLDRREAEVTAKIDQYFEERDQQAPEVGKLMAEHDALIVAMREEAEACEIVGVNAIPRHRVDTLQLWHRADASARQTHGEVRCVDS